MMTWSAYEQRVAHAKVLLALAQTPLQPRHIVDDVLPRMIPMSSKALWQIVAALQEQRLILPAATASGAVGQKITQRGLKHAEELVRGLLADGHRGRLAGPLLDEARIPSQQPPGRLQPASPVRQAAPPSAWFTVPDTVNH